MNAKHFEKPSSMKNTRVRPILKIRSTKSIITNENLQYKQY